MLTIESNHLGEFCIHLQSELLVNPGVQEINRLINCLNSALLDLIKYRDGFKND